MTDPRSPSDLLRPTLTEADDATGFNRPWSPFSMLYVAFFGGIPAAGVLLAINFRRLGMSRWFLPALIATLLLSALLYGVAIAYGASHPLGREGRLWLRYGMRALALVFALVLAAFQKRRFELFQATGLPRGGLLKPAIVAILLSTVATFLYSTLVAAALKGSPR